MAGSRIVGRSAHPASNGRLFEGANGSWPHEAIADGLWRKESLEVLLWALEHVDSLPPMRRGVRVEVLNQRIQSYGNESSFRASGRLRGDAELETAWHEADAWLAATEGRTGEDVTLASIGAGAAVPQLVARPRRRTSVTTPATSPAEHGERKQVAEPDDDRGQDAEEPLDQPGPAPGRRLGFWMPSLVRFSPAGALCSLRGRR